MLRMALVVIVLFFISGCATSPMTVVIESNPPYVEDETLVGRHLR